MPNKTIALVGLPNCGKSTLFNVLSDIKTSTSNFAGTTVQFKKTTINYDFNTFDLIDLPGIYSLNPTDAAEEVTYNYLIKQKVDLIINVIDSTMLTRSLELSVELAEFGTKMVVALNMSDEAERHGIIIDRDGLSDKLGCPVVVTAGLYGLGVKQLMEKSQEVIDNSTNANATLQYSYNLECRIESLVDKIAIPFQGYNGSNRFWAIKSIENPSYVPPKILDYFDHVREEIEKSLVELYKRDVFETISQERHHLAMKTYEQTTSSRCRSDRPFLSKIDKLFLHPIIGYFFMFAFFGLYFFLIFIIGDILSTVINYPLAALPSLYEPLKGTNLFLWKTIDGTYQGIAGVFGIVLPYFFPLILLTSLFEDSGYLSRIAFLSDVFFHRIGLHGKSVAPFILGIGCSVPAIYATRIIEDKSSRLAAAILIPFIPCSARISVIFALTAVFAGWYWSIVVFVYVLFVIANVGKLLSKYIAKPIGLILEIPDLKYPSVKLAFRKTGIRIKDFLREVAIFLIASSIILSWIELFNVSIYINTIFSPLIKTLLGLPENLGSTLIFGILRKELIIVMANTAMGVDTLSKLPLTNNQVIVFIIFVTLYFPCITTFIAIMKEFGKKVAAISAALSIIVATVSAFIFKIILNL